MHMYVTASDQRQFQTGADNTQLFELASLTAIRKQLHRKPEPVPKCLAEPMVFHIQLVALIGDPEDETTRQTILENRASQRVTAFFRSTARPGDEFTHCGIALPVLSKYYELAPALES